MDHEHTMNDADRRMIEDVVIEAMERLHVPGVALGIIHGDQTYTGAWGITNVDHPLPVTTHTLFQIGSTSKTFTGTAVMCLVEGGQVDLDEPIRTYIPTLRLADEDVTQHVTLRHVLTHVGGWAGDHFADHGWGDDALATMVANMEELPQLTPLGEVWHYNNAGFYLAGRVIEVVSGKPYETVIRELIFEPLEMQHSFFFPSEIMTERFVVGHTVKDDVPQIVRPWALPRAIAPAGGIISDVHDQLQYARFHLGDGTAPNGTRILSANNMRLMQTSQVAVNSWVTEDMGITWLMKTIDGVRFVAHGGTTTGQLSAFEMAPERRFAITVLTNADKGGTLHHELTAWAAQHLLGVRQADAVPLDLPDDQVTAFAGHYTSQTVDVDIGLLDNALTLTLDVKEAALSDEAPDPIPPMPVALYDTDRFVILDGRLKDQRGEVLRDAGSTITWIRLGGRLYKREVE